MMFTRWHGVDGNELVTLVIEARWSLQSPVVKFNGFNFQVKSMVVTPSAAANTSTSQTEYSLHSHQDDSNIQ